MTQYTPFDYTRDSKTGREHYEEAERLLHLSEQPGDDRELDLLLTTQAQVHATLALTAATLAAAHPTAPAQQVFGQTNPGVTE